MRIQRFTAPDMAAALREVRRQLGSDAVILEAKTLPARKGEAGGVIVLAALDRHLEPRMQAPTAPHLRALVAEAPSAPPSLGGPRAQASNPALREPMIEADRVAVHAETEELRDRVRYLNRLVASDHFSRIPPRWRELYLDLISAEIDSNLAFGLLQRFAVQNPDDASASPELDELRRQVVALLPEPGARPGDRAGDVVLVVGPTAAGKSTVAAGLASRCLQTGLRPGLVSIDTFRAGGPAALEQVACLLGVPFAAAFEPEDLAHEAAAGLAVCDVLIVDTPALAPQDPETFEHIERFRSALTSPVVQLVLPATAKVRDLVVALELCTPLAPASLIFTRADETASFGGLLSLSIKSQLPVSLMTISRRIVDGLVDVTREDLVTLALGCATVAPARTPAPEREIRPHVRRLVPAPWEVATGEPSRIAAGNGGAR
jgi:flagellar biosynthesis protein FlhF